MKKILHNQPYIGEEEIKAVVRTLRSKWLVPNKETGKLEDNVKQFVRRRYAVATSSGSSALHLSLLALGIGKDDEVIIPAYVCTALLNAVYYVGAIPVIVDIEKNGFTIDPPSIRKKINKKTKAIIVPHVLGFPARIDEIKKFKLLIVEDCAHALGSFYKGKPLGSFGDISIFSFYATKVITTGHGGMLVTNNRKYYKIVRDLIHYDRRKNYRVRYNYQLTDFAAAIGNVQFKRIDNLFKKRRYIASKYTPVLKKQKEIEFWPKKEDKNLNHYRFIIKFKDKKIRDSFKLNLAKRGISTVIPVENYQLLHRYLRLPKKDFPNAEGISNTTLALPIHPSLTENEISTITKTLKLLF